MANCRGGLTSVFPVVALVLVAVLALAEAAKIQTFNERSCEGPTTNTFLVAGNTCQTFIDQGAVLISEVDSGTRVSIHNQRDCEQYSSVGQFYGPACSLQGNTKIRAVWIQG